MYAKYCCSTLTRTRDVNKLSETYEQSEAKRRALFDEAHEQHNKTSKGYEHNVPCAWCGKHNDHTGLPREKGLVVDCDNCGNLNEVVQIVQKPVIQVRQCHNKPKPSFEATGRPQWDLDQTEKARVAAAKADIAKEND